jgi:signal transduction histidine kinase
MAILERESNRLSAIVSDFLDLARPEPPGGSILFLPRIIEEVRSSWEMDPRTEGFPLVLDPVPPVYLLSDSTGLHRALMNLLSNARKAIKEVPEPSVHLACLVSDGMIRLTVSDNGCGMTDEQLHSLFVPFAGSFEEGSGLGMSLVYKFIEAMGWQIEVESSPGQGTRIQVLMPQHEA